jgi:hypothetical protein
VRYAVFSNNPFLFKLAENGAKAGTIQPALHSNNGSTFQFVTKMSESVSEFIDYWCVEYSRASQFFARCIHNNVIAPSAAGFQRQHAFSIRQTDVLVFWRQGVAYARFNPAQEGRWRLLPAAATDPAFWSAALMSESILATLA